MRLPYRQRFTLIINELGAAVAGRSGDLQAALRRAVPALTETDNLLNLLANDSHTLQQLTADSNSVVTALANNSKQVNRFIVEAGNTARDTRRPGLQPARRRSSGCPGSSSSCGRRWPSSAPPPTPTSRCSPTSTPRPRTSTRCCATCRRSRSLRCRRSGRSGKASVDRQGRGPGRRPRRSSTSTSSPSPRPELAQNLAIVLHDLDDRSRAVEPDPRSPGGKGYTGLEALLQYVVQPDAGDQHVRPVRPPAGRRRVRRPDVLAVRDAGDDRHRRLKQYGAAAAASATPVLGPDQPGVNETDPSNPKACVPDPGGAPAGREGPADDGLQAAGPASAASPRERPAANGDSGSSTDAGSTGSAATVGRIVLLGRRRQLAVERGLRPRVRRPGRARRDLVGAGRWLVDLEQRLHAVVCVVGRPDPAAPQLPAGAMRATLANSPPSRTRS